MKKVGRRASIKLWLKAFAVSWASFGNVFCSGAAFGAFSESRQLQLRSLFLKSQRRELALFNSVNRAKSLLFGVNSAQKLWPYDEFGLLIRTESLALQILSSISSLRLLCQISFTNFFHQPILYTLIINPTHIPWYTCNIQLLR